MTAVKLLAGAPTGRYMKWNSINWKKVNIFVKRLQMRIAKAVKEKKFGKAKSLQWILTKSYYAKLYGNYCRLLKRYIMITAG